MNHSQIEKQIGKREVHHLCFSVYKNKWLFTGGFKKIFEEIFLEIIKEKRIYVYIYKIMPNHIHILLLKKEKQLIPTIAQYIKGISSYKIFKKYPDLKRDIKSIRLWKEGYWSVRIDSRTQFKNAYNYIKDNDLKYKKYIK